MRIVFAHNLQTEVGESHAEFDSPATVSMISGALRRLGHEVIPLDVSNPLGKVIATLEVAQPDLVFNTAEGSRGKFREAFWPALFDQLGLAYVGSDACACAITLDKQLTKQLVAAQGVPTPPAALVRTAEDLDGVSIPYPIIVKPNFEGSSKGISIDSVVDNESDLTDRTLSLLQRYPDGVLLESFIEGIDVVVPFIEGVSPETGGVLEPASYEYHAVFAQRRHLVYDATMKESGFDGLQVVCPARIGDDVRSRLVQLSRQVYETLGICDFGRLDFRVDSSGRPFFLEVNALPSMESGASIYVSGAKVGVAGVEAVLEAVLASASRRWGVLGSTRQASLH